MSHLVFVYPPSDSLVCPIHKGFFKTPVIAKCGHTFCRSCIIQHHHCKCPIDHTTTKADDLIPNLAVSGQINDMLVYCKYGCKTTPDGDLVVDDDGCKKKIKLLEKEAHEETCEYATASCPFCQIPPMRRGLLKQHQDTICTDIPCPHKSIGCTYHGTKAGVDDHVKSSCGYEGIKSFIGRSEIQYNHLRSLLEEKVSENDMLRKSILQLTDRFDQFILKTENKLNKQEVAIRNMQTSLEATQGQLADFSGQWKNNNDMRIGIDAAEVDQNGQQLLKCKGTITGHNGPVWALTIANSMLLSGSSDTTIKVWDLITYKCKQTLVGHQGIVHALSSIGTRLFSGSSDKFIRVWDLETYECIKVLEGHDDAVCTLVVAGGFLFSGSYTHLKVWDLETYNCVETLKGHNHWVRAITVNGGYLYSGSYNLVKVWDLGTFQCVKTIGGNCGSIYSIAVNNRRLIAGSYENAIIVWDLESYELVTRLSGHIGAVYAVSGSPGNRFYSGSYDSTIKVWNSDTLQCIQTLNRHTSSVESLVAHNNSIFSGSADNTIKVWRC